MRLFAGLLLLVVLLVGCGRPPELPRAEREWVPRPADAPIVVIGDTQRTLWEEEWFEGREQNETARWGLIAAIKQENPAFVVHLGDMVAWGASNVEWDYFDRLVSPLTARGIPILPVLGNHEGYGDQRAARRNVLRRFPVLARGGYYSLIHRGLGLIWLDTSGGRGGSDAQSAWFVATVNAFEANHGIRAIVVFAHHPVHTNGLKRRADPYLVSEILPCFARAGKTELFFSGHVHGYEHFEAYDKQFIVSGGGGGARVRSGANTAGPFRLVSSPGGRLPPFHFMVLREQPAGLQVSVKCLPSEEVDCQGLTTPFFLDFPPPEVASVPRFCEAFGP